MKDSSGEWNKTKTYLDALGKSGFDVFVGSESFLLAGMRNGGAGTISATANVNPAAIHKLYAEVRSSPRRVCDRTGCNSAGRADLGEQPPRLNVVPALFGKKYPIVSA